MTAVSQAQAETRNDILDRLVRSYPDALSGHDETSLIWKDGTRMPVDDGISDKTFNEFLRNASIIDQFHLPYPAGQVTKPPQANEDPGRFRNTKFFQKLYGDCKTNEVTKNLVTIAWLPSSWGKPVQVTKLNGVADSLKAISAEIDKLDSKIKNAAYPIAGVYSCRPVADTGQMSMHSYAAAIDLNLQYSDYWMWSAKGTEAVYKNRMPYEIVEIFERHGFIWGGKWSHFDTMHFEYRPEMLSKTQ